MPDEREERSNIERMKKGDGEAQGRHEGKSESHHYSKRKKNAKWGRSSAGTSSTGCFNREKEETRLKCKTKAKQKARRRRRKTWFFQHGYFTVIRAINKPSIMMVQFLFLFQPRFEQQQRKGRRMDDWQWSMKWRWRRGRPKNREYNSNSVQDKQTLRKTRNKVKKKMEKKSSQSKSRKKNEQKEVNSQASNNKEARQTKSSHQSSKSEKNDGSNTGKQAQHMNKRKQGEEEWGVFLSIVSSIIPKRTFWYAGSLSEREKKNLPKESGWRENCRGSMTGRMAICQRKKQKNDRSGGAGKGRAKIMNVAVTGRGNTERSRERRTGRREGVITERTCNITEEDAVAPGREVDCGADETAAIGSSWHTSPASVAQRTKAVAPPPTPK